MKKLFFYLLKRYTKNESDRLKVLSILSDQVENEYYEQNKYGNVYNFFIEFILSNKFINRLVNEDDDKSIETIKSGINKSYDDSIYYIRHNIKNTSEM